MVCLDGYRDVSTSRCVLNGICRKVFHDLSNTAFIRGDCEIVRKVEINLNILFLLEYPIWKNGSIDQIGRINIKRVSKVKEYVQ